MDALKRAGEVPAALATIARSGILRVRHQTSAHSAARATTPSSVKWLMNARTNPGVVFAHSTARTYQSPAMSGTLLISMFPPLGIGDSAAHEPGQVRPLTFVKGVRPLRHPGRAGSIG
jgi:hypothetical protein